MPYLYCSAALMREETLACSAGVGAGAERQTLRGGCVAVSVKRHLEPGGSKGVTLRVVEAGSPAAGATKPRSPAPAGLPAWPDFSVMQTRPLRGCLQTFHCALSSDLPLLGESSQVPVRHSSEN